MFRQGYVSAVDLGGYLTTPELSTEPEWLPGLVPTPQLELPGTNPSPLPSLVPGVIGWFLDIFRPQQPQQPQPVQYPQFPQQQPQQPQTLTYVAIGLGAAAIVGLVVYILSRRR